MNKPVPKATEIPFANPTDHGVGRAPRDFTRLDEGRYQLTLMPPGIQFEVDRLRRERDELHGELSVRCDIAGARTFDGTLNTADFNFSAARARQDRARLLAERARTGEQIDWLGLLEEFVQRVLAAERRGTPPIVLRDVAITDTNDRVVIIDGFPVVLDLPLILFGDGGTCKSLFGLYLAGELTKRGIRCLYVDWELNEHVQRRRLGAWFGSDMPDIRYLHCAVPVVDAFDQLRRVVQDEEIQYVIADSISFACAGMGKLEDSNVAIRYLNVLRRLKVGSLNIAHINKSETGDQKPFGSAFWHHGARSTWFIQRENEVSDRQQTTVTLFHRKSNTDALYDPLGYKLEFDAERRRTFLVRSNPAEAPGAVRKLSVAQRITDVVQHGRRTVTEIAEEIGVDVETVRTTAKRKKEWFSYHEVDGVYYIGRAAR